MTPGRAPFMQTGNGIPSALLQTNTSTGEDIKAEAKRKAEEDAKAKLNALGENKGGSTNIREVEGAATVTRKGQPVEKQAQTPKEIAAWKAAKAKAESEGKPFGEKYNTQTATETVKLSDTGADKPKEADKPKSDTKYWFKSDTNNKSGFGGGSEWGVANEGTIAAGEAKIASDTDPERIKRGAPFSTGEYNKFFSQPFTAQETKLYNADRIGPRSAEAVFSKDPKRQEYRQNWLNTAEERLDAGLKKRADAAAATKAKQTEAKTKFDAKAKAKAEARAVVAAKKPEELAAKKAALAAKKKAKAPTQMRKY